MAILIEKITPGGLAPWEVAAKPGGYRDAVKIQMFAIPGVRWDRAGGFYAGSRAALIVPVETLAAAGVVRVVGEWPVWDPAREWCAFADALQMPTGSSTSGTSRSSSPRSARLRSATSLLVDICSGSRPADLRDYQVDGAAWAAWMLDREGAALLADDMGLGKSAQAIAAIDALPPAATLILCPAVVREHWLGQIRRWARPDGWWHVMSYDGFRLSKDRGAIDAGNLILDEVHYLASGKAKRTRAVREWIASRRERPRILALSGTPMTARPRDLHEPLDILWPGRFGSWWSFTRRYSAGHYEEIKRGGGLEPLQVWDSSGTSRADELGARLRECMLRRTKAEVREQLPKLTRELIEVPLPAKARRSLSLARELHEGAALSALLSGVEEFKIKAAIELASDLRANDRRCLILTARRETARELAEEFSVEAVTGEIDPNARRGILIANPVGVATMHSVTTGIDLTEFDSMIFTGLDWIPSTLLQCEARIHRIGQLLPATIYYLVGMGTVDEIIRDRVLARLDTFGEVIGGVDGGLISTLRKGDDELLADLLKGLGS